MEICVLRQLAHLEDTPTQGRNFVCSASELLLLARLAILMIHINASNVSALTKVIAQQLWTDGI